MADPVAPAGVQLLGDPVITSRDDVWNRKYGEDERQAGAPALRRGGLPEARRDRHPHALALVLADRALVRPPFLGYGLIYSLWWAAFRRHLRHRRDLRLGLEPGRRRPRTCTTTTTTVTTGRPTIYGTPSRWPSPPPAPRRPPLAGHCDRPEITLGEALSAEVGSGITPPTPASNEKLGHRCSSARSACALRRPDQHLPAVPGTVPSRVRCPRTSTTSLHPVSLFVLLMSSLTMVLAVGNQMRRPAQGPHVAGLDRPARAQPSSPARVYEFTSFVNEAWATRPTWRPRPSHPHRLPRRPRHHRHHHAAVARGAVRKAASPRSGPRPSEIVGLYWHSVDAIVDPGSSRSSPDHLGAGMSTETPWWSPPRRPRSPKRTTTMHPERLEVPSRSPSSRPADRAEVATLHRHRPVSRSRS